MALTLAELAPWPFTPNWRENIIERLLWGTDVLRSPTGAEQRRELRRAPRREFSQHYTIEQRQRQLYESLMAGWGSQAFAFPLATESQLLTSDIFETETRIDCVTGSIGFQAGRFALLYADPFTYEFVEIEAFDETGLDLVDGLASDWPAGTCLYPANAAHLKIQPEVTRLTDQALEVELEWLILDPADWPAQLPAATYRSYSVLEDRPDETEMLSHAYQRLIEELDTGGALPSRRDVAGVPFDVRAHTYVLSGDVERTAHRGLLYALRGRMQAIWIPSWADDLTVVANIGSGATQVDVANIKYADYCQDLPGRRDIRIELNDGTVFYRRITASVALDDDVERLSINSALGQAVAPGDIARISYMILARLDIDAITITHHSRGDADNKLIFRGVLDDEL